MEGLSKIILTVNNPATNRPSFSPLFQRHLKIKRSTKDTFVMSNIQEEPKPDGAAFDDFFESIGKKTQNLAINEQATSNGSIPQLNEEEDQRVVDEIESLCMNCHENVVYLPSGFIPSANSRRA